MYIYLILAIGLVALVVGADWLVKGASSMASRLKIPAYVIGLTLVACGTSLPEFTVNMISAVKGYTDIAFGNVVGSNIFNILAILGIGSMIFPIMTARRMVKVDLMISLAVSLLLLSQVLIDRIFSKSMSIGFADGLLLIVVMIMYVRFLIKSGPIESTEGIERYSWPRTAAYVFAGMGLLVVGSQFLIESCVHLARVWGLSERVIALTIVSAGTSLPELATTVTAALQRKHDIAFGNIVGSNIFNILWIMSFTAIIKQVPVSASSLNDLYMAITATLILYGVIYVGKKYHIERWQGGAMLAAYVGYVVYLLG